ncbi:hypothetical protein PR003_g16656 [Phytophthora rubi]|uniref:Uncharacterized protein n=1 Tax=Phytophthora rubi TaxID=129364 RepID=A0A6A3KPY6_9STRA|nr:hypothetical protein PR002_g15669 [Phytophthora rubi]KAE9324770.1 hypothetical protein PR003_g16656 [Phytophthora rubi]
MDVNTVSGAKKVKKAAINTIKSVVAHGKKHLGKGGKTAVKQAQDDKMMADVESLNPALYEDDVSGYTAPPVESPPQSMDGVERRGT